MRRVFLLTVTFVFLCSLWSLGETPSQPAPVGKPFAWQKAAPGSQGLSGDRLDEFRNDLAKRGTKSLLVIRNDKIVYEWYADGHGEKKKHYTASLVKAIVGGLLLLLGIQDGNLHEDDLAGKYIAHWKKDSQKAKITIRHLATHNSGLSDAAHGQAGWEKAFWDRKPDPFTIARDQAPMLFEPGKGFQYSNPGMAMLSWAVTASYGGKPGTDHRTLLKTRIMDPIGVAPGDWSIGYGQTYKVDGLDLVPNWGGGSYTARAVAQVGRLMLNKGNWQGKQLLDAKLIARALSPAGTPAPERSKGDPHPASGLGWWLNHDGVWPKVPRDAFAGAGAQHQILLVVPSLNLIVVRQGGDLRGSQQKETYWAGAEKNLFNPLMECLAEQPQTGKAPYPPSPVIKEIKWAPKKDIIRKAKGSDNWPMTWADDDHLYTAYGDGNGFEPLLPVKLGLGIARVEGNPPNFKGINIRSPSVEHTKFGANGPKGCGMLMVDGKLYMWLRNVANSQLAWSTDYGKSWTKADWKFTTSFSYPTFLNFGKNYAGARDDFVYVYSADGNSAYKPADRMVLARVPKDKLLDRDAYEFFVKLDASGKPSWTTDLARRGGVFEHPKRCYRTGITYNAGLKRYLWVQILPESTDSRGPRFQGGFGVYDAPEPWGPWTTAYFTNVWDVGPGETASFPTKWMSADGKTLHLVFSGDDYFSVRQATLVCAE